MSLFKRKNLRLGVARARLDLPHRDLNISSGPFFRVDTLLPCCAVIVPSDSGPMRASVRVPGWGCTGPNALSRKARGFVEKMRGGETFASPEDC
jgi:hypothetical protein